MRPKRPGYGGGIDFETPSSNLWVGNLPPDITESDLMKLFDKHGLLDGITYYASRTYAFVYYKRVEDAFAAKESLQGFLIEGNPIRIEFAKPGKPSKNVWVGGFGSSVTKEKLEEELSKFGKIEDFKFIKDRNTALVDFVTVEDASAAVKSLNGLQIGGDRIRVDFLRSHLSRREQSDFHDNGSAQFRGMGGINPSWDNPGIMRNYTEPTYPGHKRPQPSQSFEGHKTGQPSKVLWVGYPPSVVIDEEMLHNAMILYGEIEGIKCFPARHYSLIEFRSVEEARRAKEALQGRLFNDRRIAIMFSNSDLASGKDFGSPYPGYRGQGSEMFGTEVPFPPPLMDMFPSNRGMVPNSFPGPPAPNGLLGPGVPRPFGPRGSLERFLPSLDFNDQMSDLTTHSPLGSNKKKLSPPATGLLPTPVVPGRTSHKTSGWDVLDPNHLPRESKRSRVDSLITGKGDEYIASVCQPYGANPQFIGRPSPRVHRDSGQSPADMGVAKGLPCADEDYIWRGVIAKGGTPVCHARCLPIGKGLERALPEVVNCSARTGLDMLTKHYASAIGFEIVFFLPDSKDDFANYTEFLRYLGSKNRAGVAKLDDGTTLFLVPPSEFLTVLKVAGPDRLYGVVLKLPQQLPGGASAPLQLHQPLPPIQHMESQLAPTDESVVPAPRKELPIRMDYGKPAPAETTLPPNAPLSLGSVPQAQSNNSIPSRPGAALTPELIATLATLLPTNAQAPVGQSAQPQLSSSSVVPANEKGALSQGWSQQPQMLDQTMQSSSQFNNQPYPNNTHLSTTFQPFSAYLNPSSHPIPSSHPVPVLPESMPTQNPVYNLQEQSRGPSIHPVTTQNQQFVPSTRGMQPYHLDAPNVTQKGYGMVDGTHAGSYGVADIQQPKQPASYTNRFHGANLSRPENVLPNSTGNMNVEPLNQPERFQLVSSGVGQGTAEVEIDKNQRYQSTLQFAASLLLQIQQKQQQQQQQQQQQASSHMGNQQ